MSFFADILAGAAGGLGQGIEDVATNNERSRALELQRQEKAALALELQAQKSADQRYRTDTQMEMAEMRAAQRGGVGGGGAGGRGGGSGGMSFIDQMVLDAKTPEEQQKAIRYFSLRGQDDAAALLADKFYGTPMQEKVQTFDPVAADNLSNRAYAEQNPSVTTATTTSKAKGYDPEKGRIALNRVMAMADPNKYENFIDGERKASMVDRASTAAKQQPDAESSAEMFGTLSNPNLNTSKNDIQQQRIDASRENAALRSGASLEKGEADRQSRAELAAQAALAKARALPAASKAEKVDKAAAVEEAQKRVQAVEQKPQAPRAQPMSGKANPTEAAMKVNAQGDMGANPATLEREIKRTEQQAAGVKDPESRRLLTDYVSTLKSQQARIGGARPSEQAKPKGQEVARNSLPAGAKQIGTSGGKPVFETPDGKRFVQG